MNDDAMSAAEAVELERSSLFTLVDQTETELHHIENFMELLNKFEGDEDDRALFAIQDALSPRVKKMRVLLDALVEATVTKKDGAA